MVDKVEVMATTEMETTMLEAVEEQITISQIAIKIIIQITIADQTTKAEATIT